MPKTLGKWLFLVGIVAAFVFSCVNFVISSLGLIGSLAVGLRYGFNSPIVIFCMFFFVLFAGELADMTFLSPERILSARWPNVLSVALGLVWSSFAVLILLFLFDSGLDLVRNAYWYSFLAVAVVILIADIPSLAFHLALCFKKWRNRALEISNDLERKVKESRLSVQEK